MHKVFQLVRTGGKIDLPVDNSVDVDQPPNEGVAVEAMPFGHSLDGTTLIMAVMIDRGIGVLGSQVHTLLENAGFIGRASRLVRPRQTIDVPNHLAAGGSTAKLFKTR